MESKTFEWIGDCVPSQRRKYCQLHYTAFSHGDLNVQVGDYVLIRNDESLDPEEYCFIAQVKDLYEADDQYDEPYRAVVEWFSRMIELPPNVLKSLKGIDYHCEVVKEGRNHWSNIVAAESIFAKCSIIFIPAEVSPTIAATTCSLTKNSKLFFCRWRFTGTIFEPISEVNISPVKTMKKNNKSDTRKRERLNNSKVNSNHKVSMPSSKNSSKGAYTIIHLDAPGRITRSSAKNSAVPVKTGKVPVVVKRVAKCLERDNDIQRNETCSSDSSPQHLHKLDNQDDDADVEGSSTRTDETPVKSFRLPTDHPSSAKCDSRNLKNGESSVSTDRDLTIATLRTTPVKNFYSPNKKTSRIISNSPYFKQFQSSSVTEIDDVQLDALAQFTGPLKSAQAEQGARKRNRNCRELHSKDTTVLTSSLAKRSLFQDNSDDHSVARKEPAHVRSLLFSNDSANTAEECQTSTTRYGRILKPRYSCAEVDGTPKKRKNVVPKHTSHKKKTVFYNSDVSDTASEYSPSESSSEDENSQQENHISSDLKSGGKRSSKKFQKVKFGGKSSSKKSTRMTPSTPSVPGRSGPVKTPQTLLEVSRQRLHVSAVPKSLPCREDEYADIYMFIESNLVNGTGGCMYISGVPGTGKTATVFEVMRNLQAEREIDGVPPFKFVEINGMRMTDPHQSYVQIYKSLTGETVAPQQAADLLEKRFTRPGLRKEAVVLVVDELDLLWTRKQTVMYNIFDWPSKAHSKLIVIAIANAMDLPERLLMSRISSRLGLTRKTFQPYDFKQLQEIVMCRIRELETFDPDAVQLVARKVAAVSGDARRALDVCRRATEIAEERKIPVSPKKGLKSILVGIAHVDIALQEMFSSPMIMAIRSSSAMQKMFLRGIAAEFQRTGLEETVFTKVYNQLVSLCRFEGIRPPNTSQVFAACAHLASSHLLLVDSSENDLFQKIRLNISVDDVNYALSERSI